MKIKTITILVLSCIFALQASTCRGKVGSLVYSVSNLPDLISGDSTIQLNITIENVSKQTITLESESIPIEIFINKIGRKDNYKQKIVMDTERILANLKPNQIIYQKVTVSELLYPQDTLICPEKPNYKSCKTAFDSLLIDNSHLCNKVYRVKPIGKGKYHLIINVNIKEKDNTYQNWKMSKSLEIY